METEKFKPKRYQIKLEEHRGNCEFKGYTQQFIADNLDMNKNSYSLIELNKTKKS